MINVTYPVRCRGCYEIDDRVQPVTVCKKCDKCLRKPSRRRHVCAFMTYSHPSPAEAKSAFQSYLTFETSRFMLAVPIGHALHSNSAKCPMSLYGWSRG